MTEPPSTMDYEHLMDFFVRYGEALAAGDLPEISGCYDIPALVIHDLGAIPIAEREQIEANFDGAAERYRAAGLVAARPTVLNVETLTGKLAIANVHWDYCDADGKSKQQDGYRYVLRFTGEGPRIQVVIPTPPPSGRERAST